MSIGNLFLQQSGESGWKQVPNSGDKEYINYDDGSIIMSIGAGYSKDHSYGPATLHPHHLGIGTTGADHKVVIADTGVEAFLALRHSDAYTFEPEGGPATAFNTSLIYTDYTGGHAGRVGIKGNSLNIIKFGTGQDHEIIFGVGGGPPDGVNHPAGLSGRAILTNSGNFGVGELQFGFRPQAKLEIEHTGTEIGEDLTVIRRSDQLYTPQFKLTNRGKLGLNTDHPQYTLSVSGDINSDGTQVGNYGTIFSQNYIYQTSGFWIGEGGQYGPKHLGGEELTADTFIIDFNGPSFRNIELTGSLVTFQTKNRSAYDEEIKAVAIKLHAGAYPGDSPKSRAMSFHGDIKFLGIRPDTLIADNVAVVSFNSFGPNESDTIAVYRSSDEESQQGPQGPQGISRDGYPSEGFANKIIGGDFSTNPWQRLGAGQSGFNDVQSGQFTADRFVFLKSGNARPDGDINLTQPSWNEATGDIRLDIFRTQVNEELVGYGDAGYPSGAKNHYWYVDGESIGAVPSWSPLGISTSSSKIRPHQVEYPVLNALRIECTSGISGNSLFSGDNWEPRTVNVESNINHAGKYAAIETRLEGYDARELMSNIFTLCFYVNANTEGWNTVYLKNANSTATYIENYEYCETGTWKKFEIPFFPFGTPFASTTTSIANKAKNIGGDPTPNTPLVAGTEDHLNLPAVYDYKTGLGLENEIGLRIGWVLGAASDLRVPEGRSGMWTEGNYYTWSGHPKHGLPTNHVGVGTPQFDGASPPGGGSQDYNLPSFSIANVSIYKGNIYDSNIMLRPIETEHQLCKRYFEKLDFASGDPIGVGQAIGKGVSASKWKGISGVNPTHQSLPPIGAFPSGYENDPYWDYTTLLIQSSQASQGAVQGDILFLNSATGWLNHAYSGGPAQDWHWNGVYSENFGRVNRWNPVTSTYDIGGRASSSGTFNYQISGRRPKFHPGGDYDWMHMGGRIRGEAFGMAWTEADHGLNLVHHSDGKLPNGVLRDPPLWGNTSIRFNSGQSEPRYGPDDHHRGGGGDFLEVTGPCEMIDGEYSSVATRPSMLPALEPFTFEWWMYIKEYPTGAYPNTHGADYTLFHKGGHYTDPSYVETNEFAIYLGGEYIETWPYGNGTPYASQIGRLKLRGFKGWGWAAAAMQVSNTVLSKSGWHHIAINRGGGAPDEYQLIINGVIDSQWYYTSPFGITQSSANLYIGNGAYADSLRAYSGPSLGSRFDGYMDDIRLTTGMARYSTPNFPPTPLSWTFQPTEKFGGVKLDYRDKRIIPSVAGSGYLMATDVTYEPTLLTGTGFEGITKTQASVSGVLEYNSLVGGHATTLKPSGSYNFWIDAELKLPEDEII